MAETKKYMFKVTGMHCASCTVLITEDLSAVPGIKNVKVDLPKKVVEFETDKEGSPAEIAKKLTAVIEPNGYALEV